MSTAAIPRAPADAPVARGDARDVGAVGADRHLRLGLQPVRRHPLLGRRGDRGVEVLGDQLRAVVERRRLPLGRRRARVAPLVPDREEPRAAPRQEVGMGEVEAADVDHPDQHALPVAVAPGVPEAPEGRRGRSGRAGLDDRGRQGQRLAELHVADVVALRELQRARHRQLGGGKAPLHRQEGAAARGRQPGVHLGAAEVDEDAYPGVGQGGEVALRERPRRGVRRRRVARAGRRATRPAAPARRPPPRRARRAARSPPCCRSPPSAAWAGPCARRARSASSDHPSPRA